MGRGTGQQCPNPHQGSHGMRTLYMRHRSNYTRIGYICPTCGEIRITAEIASII